MNNIQYVAFASTGNAADFGDCTVTRTYCGGASNSTRGISVGGADSATNGNVMDFGLTFSSSPHVWSANSYGPYSIFDTLGLKYHSLTIGLIKLGS